MAEIVNTGVTSRTLQDWYNAVVAFKRSVWGPTYDIDPSTKQGVDVTQLAELLYNAEQNNVSSYGQLNLNTASGINLDYLGLVRGISRNPGTPQQLNVIVTSTTTGYTIEPSLVFRTLDGLYSYYSPVATEINSLQTQITLVYTADGNPDVAPGDGLRTVDYFPNIQSVIIQPGGVIAGADTESDASYRKRMLDSDIGFMGTLELMTSEMRTIAGLAKCKIYSNDESETDSRGIPAYATEFVVAPDSETAGAAFEQLVAQKICDIKEPGAPLHGETSLVVPNYYGENKTIKFTVATRKSIEMFVKIAANPVNNVLDMSGVPLRKTAIKDYVNSNNEIGQSIAWSTLLGIAAGDSGYIIVDWGLRFKGTTEWTQADLSLGVREYGWVDVDADNNIPDIVISTNPNE